jgi:DDE superfamily endonuclease
MRVVLPEIPSTRRNRVCLAHKQHIIRECAQVGNVRMTARKYGVQPQQIRRWKQSFDCAMERAVDIVVNPLPEPVGGHVTLSRTYRQLHATNRHRFNTGGHPTLFTTEFLACLKQVIEDRRNNNLSVSMHIVRIESRKIHPTVFEHIAETAFNHRMYRMMKKWEISYRRKTTTAKVAQNTRHYEEIKSEFLKYYKFKVNLYNFSNDDIFNADQTNLPFSIECNYTWARRNSRSVPVPSIESNQRATVMLGCNASGSIKLTPFMVFKGSSNPTGRIYQELRQKENYPHDVEYAVQEKAWFNEQIMLMWIEKIWKPVIELREYRVTYLLLDDFGVHLTATVKEAFLKLKTEVDIIPPGYTSVLQVMDVGINKPFKDYTRRQYDEWCEMNTNGTRAHRRDAARWCSSSWSQISPITIMKTWNHIGYTSVEADNIVNSLERRRIIRQTDDDSDDTQDTEDSTVAYSSVEEESEVDSAEEVIIESDSSSADSDSDDDLMYFDFFINNLNRDNISTQVSTTQVSTTQVSTNKDDESK